MATFRKGGSKTPPLMSTLITLRQKSKNKGGKTYYKYTGSAKGMDGKNVVISIKCDEDGSIAKYHQNQDKSNPPFLYCDVAVFKQESNK